MVADTAHSGHTNGHVNGDDHPMRAKNVGIRAMEVYFPKRCVDQAELEKFDGASTGKYTAGLGQHRMAFCDDREDINSICLTVVQNLMSKYSISPSDIGRLEVGTETIIDKSKSVKTVLMQLFAPHNHEIEGVDTTNACYGGTNALFNAINWCQSESWDGRLAIVVAGDIAVYASGNARPTGGAGVVAMLIGPDAPLVIDNGLRATYMDHAWDFFKPDLSSEFPVVDGKLSVSCYLNAIDKCYSKYIERLEKKQGLPAKSATMETLDYVCFHSPYTKLVQKSFARLSFNDFMRSDDSENWKKLGDLSKFKTMKVDDTYADKEIEKTFMEYTKAAFKSKVDVTLLAARELGNMYCGSLYGGLASLISEVEPESMVGKRITLFAYGSGLASSMFSFTVAAPPTEMHEKLNVRTRLSSRTIVPPVEFDSTMQLREHTHNLKGHVPQGSVDGLFPGTFYLQLVDDKFRRAYVRTKEADKASSATLVAEDIVVKA